MEPEPARFDPYLSSINADDLKPMVRIWGGESNLRKAECIAMIRQCLADPQRVQAAVADLNPFEQTALSLLKCLGNSIEAGAFGLALRASGAHMSASARLRSRDPDAMLRTLIRRGLVLCRGSYSPVSAGISYGHAVAFSDERLLRCVDSAAFQPLDVAPVKPPNTALWRRPQSVALDLAAVLQAIDALGGLSLTNAGTVRVSDQRKLGRAMQWEEEVDLDGLPFPRPMEAFVTALRCAGLLTEESGKLLVSDSVSQVTKRPYREQVGALLHGFLLAEGWNEWASEDRYLTRGRRYCQARVALIAALAALPHEKHSFFAVEDFDHELFARIGEHFALGFRPYKPHVFSGDDEEERRAIEEWRARLRDEWATCEREWLNRALCTWLYALGMVEVGLEDGALVSFRLTELGRSVLRPELASSPAAPADTVVQAWVVQPNFDVVVYLDRATPAQLAFIERHAERVGAKQHTAHYRLTRESVYEGLQTGTLPDELVNVLRAGSQAELPQNVVVDLGEWAAACEHVVVYRQARLLEFPTAGSRQAALASGTRGRPVGDRFVWLGSPDSEAATSVSPDENHAARRIDYAQPLPRCLSVAENGLVGLKPVQWRDLLIEAQLDRWAERETDSTWRLTAGSVSAAIEAGARTGQLMKLLKDRLTRRLPPLLEIALRAWTGKQFVVELAPVTVLRCSQPELLAAIANTPQLKRYLLGFLGPEALAVSAQHLEALKAHLAWAGLEVSPQLTIAKRSPSALSNDSPARIPPVAEAGEDP